MRGDLYSQIMCSNFSSSVSFSAVEKVYSNSFSDQKQHALEDYIEVFSALVQEKIAILWFTKIIFESIVQYSGQGSVT